MTRTKQQRQPKGFTLIELLVVIAIIAILIALLVPAVQKVREAAARTQCINNLKNIGLALHSFHDTNKALPPGAVTDQPPYGTGGGWGSSWKVFILPYIEQGNIFTKWQFNAGNSGYTNANNMGLIHNVTIPVYRCPSSTLPDMYAGDVNVAGMRQMYTTYTGVMGSALTTTDTANVGCCDGGSGLSSKNGLLFQGSKNTLPGISDGTSNTWIVGEQSGHVRNATGAPVGVITSQGPHGWTMGCDSNSAANGSRVFNCTAVRYEINRVGIVSNGTSGASTGVNNNAGANIPFSSNHTGGANMLAADGTVRFFSNSTPLTTLSALCTRDGGEAVAMEP